MKGWCADARSIASAADHGNGVASLEGKHILSFLRSAAEDAAMVLASVACSAVVALISYLVTGVT
jgi:siroheme synthase